MGPAVHCGQGDVAGESTIIQRRIRQYSTTVAQDNLDEKLIDYCARGLDKSKQKIQIRHKKAVLHKQTISQQDTF